MFKVEIVEYDNRALYFITEVATGASIEDSQSLESAQSFADQCNAEKVRHPEYSANQIFSTVMSELYA